MGEGAEDWESQVEVRQLSVAVHEHGTRIDKWLAQQCPEFSRGYFQQLLADGCVHIHGKAVAKASHKVKVGDPVRVELRPTAQAQAFLPESIPLQVLYEDEHLLVINKPAGMVVHPAAGHWTGTLLNALLAYHEGAARLPRAGIVHRLDKDTSGAMLVGKTQPAVDALVRMIAQRDVHRIYVALAQGPWRHGDEVLVDQALGRDPRNRLRMAVLSSESTAAKPAQTRVRRLDGNARYTWVGCKLHTGRTHQIRVHLSWLGLPLVGDAVYGGAAALGVQRQALHACRLALSHPITGAAVRIECPLPDDLAQAVPMAGLDYNWAALWRLEDF